MKVAFHWIRVQTFCYATENRELLEETMAELVGDPEALTEEVSESEHGNTIVIIEARLTKQKSFVSLFERIGPDIRDWLVRDIDNRVDEDCVLYLRLDKQAAVQGRYEVAHHGDVIAITGKVQAHPANKNSAMATARGFLESLGHLSDSG